MRLPYVMHSHLLTPPGTTSVEDSWSEANHQALALYHAEQWEAAAELWTAALYKAPSFALAPDTHALLLSNLAQALFRGGDREGAVDAGRRSLSARSLCCESDSDAPMARARADLAVYLTAVDQTDEATAMLQSACQALELHFGDEDPQLASVLENLARVALVTNAPAIAEPLLLRLHALLDANGEDPSRIEPLIARVAAARNPSAEPTRDSPHAEVFPPIFGDEFDLIDDSLHTPMSSPSAQSIRSEGLIEPGLHTTPSWTARTNPLGFEVQYGVPIDESYSAPPQILRDQ